MNRALSKFSLPLALALSRNVQPGRSYHSLSNRILSLQYMKTSRRITPTEQCSSNFNESWNVRGFKNFGHKRERASKLTVGYMAFLVIVMYGTWVDKEWIKNKLFPKADAATISQEDRESNSEEEKQEKEIANEKKSKKPGFRERKIIEYENRIRQYSSPDKVFRYFATLQAVINGQESEIFMTPDDFLRSITPGLRQPEGLGLDQFRRFDPKSWDKIKMLQNSEVSPLTLHRDSIFYRLGSAGLISYSDYIFLLTVLSTSRRQFEIAFRLFDLNGDGEVDADEFFQVAALARYSSAHGARHREMPLTHAHASSYKLINSALSTYFFGPNLDKKLTIERFLAFQAQLQTEIQTLEFHRAGPRPADGHLPETAFAELLLAYAGYPHKRKSRMIKRVQQKYADMESERGISLQDYLSLFQLLNGIQDVDTALSFYNIAGAAIDEDTFIHVARTVARVELSKHLVDVIFTIFDEDQDGHLSNKEFVWVMKQRVQRGLEKPKDTGFTKAIASMWRCALATRPALMDTRP